MDPPNTLKLDGLTVKFCGKNVDVPTPEANSLPIMINLCPDDFSTLDYYEASLLLKQKLNHSECFNFPAVAEDRARRTFAYLLESTCWLDGPCEQN